MGAARDVELAPAFRRGQDTKLRLHVIYTIPETTRASLCFAGLLAHDLGATIELLVARVIPYPLPLNNSPAQAGFTEEFLKAIVSESEVDVNVKILPCRDREETIPQWLPAESIVVIGSRRRWGPGSSRGLVRIVRRKGHHVIVVDATGKLLTPANFCSRRKNR